MVIALRYPLTAEKLNMIVAGELCIENPHEAAVQLLSMVKREQWNQLELNIQPSLSEEETKQDLFHETVSSP